MENINFANIVGRYSLAEAKARIENFLSQYGRQVEAQVWIRILAVYCACHCWKDVLPRLRLFMDSLSDDCPALPRTELTLLRRMMALVGLEPPSWLEEESCLAEENALRHTCEPAVLAVEWLENNSPVLLFREECPACGNVTEFTLRGVLVPVLAREETEWLCPHCLARRLWAPGKVREILWNHYLGVLRALPGASSARLCSDDIDRLLSLAAAMYPIAPVRFGELWAGGVGHLIENTAIYMEYKARGLLSPSLDLIGINKDSSKTNAYLLKKWSETLEIYPAASQLARHVRKTPLEVHELAWYTKAIEWDPCCVMCQSVPPFTFTAREHCRARHNLENMGIPANAPFVCLFVRDSAFDRKVRQISDEQCALYNSRNANVDNYRLACEYLASLGYYVLRMGSAPAAPLSWAQKQIIDYAANYRTEFMDVWLFANCALCLGTSSGLTSLSSVLFNKPCLFTDYPHIVWEPMAFMNDLLILPKTPRHASGRRVTFAEYVRGGFYKGNIPEEFGITLQDNTQEEILMALKERLAMMQGTWRPTPRIESLQRRIWNWCFPFPNFPMRKRLDFGRL